MPLLRMQTPHLCDVHLSCTSDGVAKREAALDAAHEQVRASRNGPTPSLLRSRNAASRLAARMGGEGAPPGTSSKVDPLSSAASSAGSVTAATDPEAPPAGSAAASAAVSKANTPSGDDASGADEAATPPTKSDDGAAPGDAADCANGNADGTGGKDPTSEAGPDDDERGDACQSAAGPQDAIAEQGAPGSGSNDMATDEPN